jgi:hypothetical protein
MKTTFISVMALGVAVAMAGPADRALADEPMVLTNAQLDRVTAGGEALATLVINRLHGATPSPNTADNVSIVFGRAEEPILLQLDLTVSIPEHPIPDKDHRGWSDIRSFSQVIHKPGLR